LALRCGASWTESYYCNEKLDGLLDAVDATVDVGEKQKLYCQIQTIMQEDAGYIIPFFAATFGASRSNVHLPSTWSRAGALWREVWISEK
jgi:peptide/nickel transport system substrate-binding protein